MYVVFDVRKTKLCTQRRKSGLGHVQVDRESPPVGLRAATSVRAERTNFDPTDAARALDGNNSSCTSSAGTEMAALYTGGQQTLYRLRLLLKPNGESAPQGDRALARVCVDGSR